MKIVSGDLIQMALDGQFDVIVHGCNCFCTMRAGLAAQIAACFPEAVKADCTTKKGDREKLGTCSVAKCDTRSGTVAVVNAYTQFEYGRGKRYADYDAIRSCLRWVALFSDRKRIGIPKIGCGLAGGDWKIIEAIMDEEMCEQNATVVEFVQG